MSNKLQNRILLPNGQFVSFLEEKLDKEVKYEQRKVVTYSGECLILVFLVK